MSYRTVEGDNVWAIATCDRCGIEWTFDRTYLSRLAYNTDVCADCRRKPVKACGPADDYCTPWKGDVDLDTMQPLNADGSLYRPGIRICGNRDCVRPKHLISDEMGQKARERVERLLQAI